MNAFLYGITLQWKLDLRNKGILLTYYIVPIVFFVFMGGIFTSVDPEAYKTLIPSMSIFGISMGSLIGTPTPLVEFIRSDMKKAYAVGHIPIWTFILNNFISAFIHLYLMSMIVFFIAPIAFHSSVPENLPLYFSMLGLFLITSLAVGTIPGLIIKSTSKLAMITQFIFLPSVMLSGIMFPSSMLPDALRHVASIFPAAWGFLAMSSNRFESRLIFPFLLIDAVCLVIILWKLRQLKAE